jgi:hypothetical protein
MRMYRTATVVALAAVLAAVFASAALARDFQCKDRPCEGTQNGDVIIERNGDGRGDKIYGRAGNDTIRADIYTDDLDTLVGGRGDDTLYADDGDPADSLYGGKGTDTCYTDTLSDLLASCEVIHSR